MTYNASYIDTVWYYEYQSREETRDNEGEDSWSGTWKFDPSKLFLSNPKGDLWPIYILKGDKLVPEKNSQNKYVAKSYSMKRGAD